MWFPIRRAIRRENTGAVDRVVGLCPAKLNLALHIKSRRPDGFHELETLLTPISLFDTLEFRASPGEDIQLRCQSPDGSSLIPLGIPDGPDNLVYRAIDALRTAAGIRRGADVVITKRIPHAAGLGGASSNAAVALLAANTVWQLGWSHEALAPLAAELGSDVPMFIRCQSAIGRGRGERLEAAELPHWNFVVVKPVEGLSTPAVFAELDLDECRQAAERDKGGIEEFVEHLNATESKAASAVPGLRNDLERPARRLSREIETVFQDLQRVGLQPHMSGSGTSCFAWCDTARAAKRAANQLGNAGHQAYWVTNLG